MKSAILRRLKRESRWCGFSVHAAGASLNGLPDIVGCMSYSGWGRFVAIECKTARGRLSKLQEFRLERFRAVGALVVVARSVSDVETALGL
ncbi:MAG TPA: VRR-NUC domain-containing protein [Planctomycetota bacterium]|nr:VRR-NUC domain-containing protein [Planctomycetota bacterium]